MDKEEVKPMTKKNYRKLSIVLVLVIIMMGWLFINPKAYNRIHGHMNYYMVKRIVPDWISDWYNPYNYDIKK